MAIEGREEIEESEKNVKIAVQAEGATDGLVHESGRMLLKGMLSMLLGYPVMADGQSLEHHADRGCRLVDECLCCLRPLSPGKGRATNVGHWL